MLQRVFWGGLSEEVKLRRLLGDNKELACEELRYRRASQGQKGLIEQELPKAKLASGKGAQD